MIPSFRPQDEIELLQKLAGYLPKDHCNFYVERVSKARAAALSHLNKSDLSTADFAERLRASKECTSSTLMRTDFRAACNGLTEGQRKTDEDTPIQHPSATIEQVKKGKNLKKIG